MPPMGISRWQKTWLRRDILPPPASVLVHQEAHEDAGQDRAGHALAHHAHHAVHVQGVPAVVVAHAVDRLGQVAAGVHQRAVEIEDQPRGGF